MHRLIGDVFPVFSVPRGVQPGAVGRNQKQILRYAQDDVILSKRSDAKNLLSLLSREDVRP